MAKDFSDEQKKKILDKRFKGQKTITDPFGRITNRNNAQIDHKVPKSKGGKATYKNAQVLSTKSNLEKSDKLSGTINKKTFKVNKKTQTMSVKNKK